MIQYCYVQCRSWAEVEEVIMMSRREGYRYSVNQQTLMLTYWRQP